MGENTEKKNTRKDFMYVILRLHLKDLHTMAQNRSFYYSSLRQLPKAVWELMQEKLQLSLQI